MKLYKVRCRGMHGRLSSDTVWGIAYVVAAGPTEAYEMVRQYLVDEGIGFGHEQELQTVELMADEAEYPNCGYRLYLPALADNAALGEEE